MPLSPLYLVSHLMTSNNMHYYETSCCVPPAHTSVYISRTLLNTAPCGSPTMYPVPVDSDSLVIDFGGTDVAELSPEAWQAFMAASSSSSVDSNLALTSAPNVYSDPAVVKVTLAKSVTIQSGEDSQEGRLLGKTFELIQLTTPRAKHIIATSSQSSSPATHTAVVTLRVPSKRYDGGAREQSIHVVNLLITDSAFGQVTQLERVYLSEV